MTEAVLSRRQWSCLYPFGNSFESVQLAFLVWGSITSFNINLRRTSGHFKETQCKVAGPRTIVDIVSISVHVCGRLTRTSVHLVISVLHIQHRYPHVCTVCPWSIIMHIITSLPSLILQENGMRCMYNIQFDPSPFFEIFEECL